jgi:hypothetical protein
VSGFLDNVRKIPGLGGIPGGEVELESVEREKARARAIAEREIEVRREKGLDYSDLVEPEDSFGIGDLMTRVLALTLTGLGVVFFIIGTYFWTQMTAGNIGPLGYAMTPIGMYGILIILIPMMGIIHSLWTSSDVKRRKAESLKAARDKLRVSLLATNDNVTNNVRSAPMPTSMLFGESEEDLRRRRREQQQGRGG